MNPDESKRYRWDGERWVEAPEVGHCRDCQHYGAPLPVDANGYDEHGDKNDHPTYGRCQLAEAEMQDDMIFGPDRPTLAFAVDGEEYRAGLRVHPDFGCVQWEG